MTPLYDYLKTTQGFISEALAQAFGKVDRLDFVPDIYKDSADVDAALPIGHGATISQPTTVLFMLDSLDPKPGEKILDLGSGSGWTTGLLATAVGPEGKVFGVELVPELVKWSKKNLAKYNLKNVQILQAGEERGLPSKAPFDKILVSAAATELPQDLVKQLKVGGRMVIPVKNSVWQIDRISPTKTLDTEFEGFAFVPLR